MNRVEMVMRRRVFRAFVKADPVSIVMIRSPGREKTPAGGWVSSGIPKFLDPQEGRIVQSKRRYDAGLVNTEAGDIPHTELLLLGYYTMNVQVDDVFSWLGMWYTVRGIKSERTESTLCAIEYVGPYNGI